MRWVKEGHQFESETGPYSYCAGSRWVTRSKTRSDSTRQNDFVSTHESRQKHVNHTRTSTALCYFLVLFLPNSKHNNKIRFRRFPFSDKRKKEVVN